MILRIALLVMALFCIFEVATAKTESSPEILASCGQSSGHTYYHFNDIISQDEAGWSTDKISGGSIIVQKTNTEYDLIFRDKLGLRSAKDDGATIFSPYQSNDALSLVVIYLKNGNTEVYNFQHLGTKDAEVSWTSTKVSGLFLKSAVFYSKCQKDIKQ